MTWWAAHNHVNVAVSTLLEILLRVAVVTGAVKGEVRFQPFLRFYLAQRVDDETFAKYIGFNPS